MKKIALIPVYNEEGTLPAVLESIARRVDRVLIVDDGSRDSSLDLARDFAARRAGVTVLRLPENRGMSAALREGFLHLVERLRAGDLGPEDVVLTLDADGQHDALGIGELCLWVEEQGLDVALTRRDFSLYPAHKRLGNMLMTAWGRVWSGFPYHDVESGFRAMRLKVLSPVLEYYTGRRYSCAQEIAVLTARLGFRVDNSCRTVIQRYRSQTGFRDVIINGCLGFWAFARWLLRRRSAVGAPTAALCASSEHP